MKDDAITLTTKFLQKKSDCGLKAWQHFFLEQAQILDSKQQMMPEHARNYRQGLSGWLNRVYLQMQALVSEQYQVLVDQYLSQVPLNCLNRGGFEHDFILVVKEQAPQLFDLAKTDLLIHTSYCSADHEGFPHPLFASLPAQAQLQAVFQLAPSILTFESGLPLDRIWSLYKSGQASTAQDLLFSEDTRAVDVAFMVFRPEYQPVVVRMNRAEQKLVALLREQVCLGALPEDTQTIVPGWIQSGKIVGFL